MDEHSGVVVSSTVTPGGCVALSMSGTLDSSTYRQVRDCVIKAALDEPPAVIVDVSELVVTAGSAWAVFTSARWHVSTWPDVPILLVCDHEAGRAAVVHSGITRYVPVHADAASATRVVVDAHALRRRAASTLMADPASLGQARNLVAQWLTQWGWTAMIRTASTVATVLTENVLQHTRACPVLRVKADTDRITVAVSDDSAGLAVRREHSEPGAHTVSGLAIVAALSRSWGCTPTTSGKTVWALLGPENQL